MMKTPLAILLGLVLCLSLAGCIRISQQADGATVNPTEGPTQAASTETPPPEASEEPSDAPASEAPSATKDAPEPSSAQASGRLPGLAAYYPWGRVPLPEGSEFVKVDGIENAGKYIEYIHINIPLTKTQAIDYFKPLLEKDSNYFNLEDNLDHPPLEIQGAHPDVVSYASLYSRYTTEAEANIGVIIVNLYTPADGETVLVAVIQVNYLTKPE